MRNVAFYSKAGLQNERFTVFCRNVLNGRVTRVKFGREIIFMKWNGLTYFLQLSIHPVQ